MNLATVIVEEKFKHLSENYPDARRIMNFLYWRDYDEYKRFISWLYFEACQQRN